MRWNGKGGAHLSDANPLLSDLAMSGPPPGLIIVHLGTNDLVQLDAFCLRQSVRIFMSECSVQFPRAHLVWSDILPRACYFGALSQSKLEMKRRSINKYHGTESALLRVHNDILCTVDDKRGVFLVLLDLSAAFDTIDHHILLQRLETRYGANGTVLEWFSSYLKDRSQSKSIHGTNSYDVICNSGVPQGSVVGPLLFALFTAPLKYVITSHDIHVAVYADDTQLYIDFNPTEREGAVRRLQECMNDVYSWSASDKLGLNGRKTELQHMTTRFNSQPQSSHGTTDPPSLKVGQQIIHHNESARSLGIIVDYKLRMSDHVNRICRSSFAALCGIGRIRQHLDDDWTAKVVHAFVTSRLDLCNSLLYGLPESETHKLQRVQNSAAMLVARTPRC